MTRELSIDAPRGSPGASPPPPRFDWDRGAYEESAPSLRPAAATVLDHAAAAIGPLDGRHVLDVGCGSGNASVLAALRGARVTGVDPAERLREVAAGSARDRGLAATFLPGEAADLPLPDGSADAAVSVFGVIFAPDAAAAAAELARVTAEDGCIVLSAWLPEGPLHDANDVPRRAVATALGQRDVPRGFPWHDADAVSALFARHGFATAFARHRVALTAPSLDAFMDVNGRHPLALAARDVLEARGAADGVRRRIRAVYDAANENPGAFRVTAPYVVATARRA
jgi:SAM-dependent methyltransferase